MARSQAPQPQSSATPNREELLQMAINTAQAGNRDAESKNERAQWLNRVLQVNPNNEGARDALERMTRSSAARQNRTFIIFGVVLVVLVIVFIAVFILLTSTR
jgi:ABC-type multidrug transport system permease subunit